MSLRDGSWAGPCQRQSTRRGPGWLWAEPCVHPWNSDLIKIVCKLLACMQLSVHPFRKKILFRTSCLHFISKHCCDLCVFFPPAAYSLTAVHPAQLGFLTIKNILFASLLISPTCCSTEPSAWHPFALAHVCLEQRFCLCSSSWADKWGVAGCYRYWLFRVLAVSKLVQTFFNCQRLEHIFESKLEYQNKTCPFCVSSCWNLCLGGNYKLTVLLYGLSTQLYFLASNACVGATGQTEPKYKWELATIVLKGSL